MNRLRADQLPGANLVAACWKLSGHPGAGVGSGLVADGMGTVSGAAGLDR